MAGRSRTGWMLAALLAAGAAMAGDARVKDGDTLRVGARDVRLFGIDAPEAGQTCARADGSAWACGRAAAERLAELVAAGPVRCRPEDTDRYGRLVSTCTVEGVDLGARLVSEGLARAYARYSDAYLALEAEARAAGRGLWQGEAEAPWRYRAETTGGFAPAAGTGPPPPGCTIKGNVSAKGERIYHLPGGPGYARTRIDTDRGEAWFCDEEAARAAGFRPPRGAR
ncbi:thermonuclease family protein [Amaricoccus sp.]|uniref:thermonuclease family protein n=1 Tax=Amaricoccus sp. TaxID=1872485 RepID=UPI00262BEFE6|nr:thermonuclease family protein [Amaricoccus sp.]HRO11433.1 thermonuclease family protein [Amaricoccus sp.]